MLSAISIACGYLALVAMFGWVGVLAIVVHAAIMLAALPRGPAPKRGPVDAAPTEPSTPP